MSLNEQQIDILIASGFKAIDGTASYNIVRVPHDAPRELVSLTFSKLFDREEYLISILPYNSSFHVSVNGPLTMMIDYVEVEPQKLVDGMLEIVAAADFYQVHKVMNRLDKDQTLLEEPNRLYL